MVLGRAWTGPGARTCRNAIDGGRMQRCEAALVSRKIDMAKRACGDRRRPFPSCRFDRPSDPVGYDYRRVRLLLRTGAAPSPDRVLLAPFAAGRASCDPKTSSRHPSQHSLRPCRPHACCHSAARHASLCRERHKSETRLVDHVRRSRSNIFSPTL